jgi:hypothetical protein
MQALKYLDPGPTDLLLFAQDSAPGLSPDRARTTAISGQGQSRRRVRVAKPGQELAFYFSALFALLAAGVFVLGGDTAVPAGECAPDASLGLEVSGVI